MSNKTIYLNFKLIDSIDKQLNHSALSSSSSNDNIIIDLFNFFTKHIDSLLNGKILLKLAIEEKSLDYILKLLSNDGAIFNLFNSFNRTSSSSSSSPSLLYYCIKFYNDKNENELKIFEKLIEWYAGGDRREDAIDDFNTVIKCCIIENKFNFLDKLIKLLNININYQYSNGNTLLHLAFYRDMSDMEILSDTIKEAVDDANRQIYNNKYNNNIEKLIFDIELNFKYLEQYINWYHVIKILLDNNVNCQIKNDMNKTPLEIGLESYELDKVKLLLEQSSESSSSWLMVDFSFENLDVKSFFQQLSMDMNVVQEITKAYFLYHLVKHAVTVTVSKKCLAQILIFPEYQEFIEYILELQKMDTFLISCSSNLTYFDVLMSSIKWFSLHFIQTFEHGRYEHLFEIISKHYISIFW